LFRGWFEPWWPAILMGLAFLGFGLGELFGRRGPSVLHKPLLRTGLFLPLFPLLSFWIGGGALDHSLIFLLMGILYAAASSTRGSYGLALLAVLATNSSLWHLLSRGNGLDLLRAHTTLHALPNKTLRCALRRSRRRGRICRTSERRD
jgi:hypothetical protein